jgi:ABC-2 type transport system permease protein/lipopolysaccharide transport system permease protein
MAWFYLTPIIYPREIVPPKFSWITQMNPMGYLLDLFRDPIYFGRVPQTSTILISVGVSLLSLLIGWWTFTRKAKDLAYLV